LSWLLLCLSLTLSACVCVSSMVFVFLQFVFNVVSCCGFVCSDNAVCEG